LKNFSRKKYPKLFSIKNPELFFRKSPKLYLSEIETFFREKICNFFPNFSCLQNYFWKLGNQTNFLICKIVLKITLPNTFFFFSLLKNSFLKHFYKTHFKN
jgi:hypothetical protein